MEKKIDNFAKWLALMVVATLISTVLWGGSTLFLWFVEFFGKYWILISVLIWSVILYYAIGGENFE